MRSKDSIFYVLCYQTPKPQEPLFSIYHDPPFHAPLQQGAQHTHVTLVLPALEEISLILQILTDSDNQTNTCQCQVTLTWNVLFSMESKESKSDTWIEAPDLSQLGFGGKLFDHSDLHFLIQNMRMVIIITIHGCKENKI